MSQIYMPRGRREKTSPKAAREIRERTPLATPASNLGDGMGSKPDEGMLSRFRRHFPNEQIPAAESEADRPSNGLEGASASGTTPAVSVSRGGARRTAPSTGFGVCRREQPTEREQQ